MATILTAKAPKHFADKSQPRHHKAPPTERMKSRPLVTIDSRGQVTKGAVKELRPEPGTRTARKQAYLDYHSDEAYELRKMLADALSKKS
jgi:hypothetical protein